MHPDDGPAPILAVQDPDPEVQERVDAFVVGLGETIDLLQDDELARDWAQLIQRAGALRSEADGFGFSRLADSASRLMEACKEGRAKVIRDRLVELTEVGHRVRLGHRGSA